MFKKMLVFMLVIVAASSAMAGDMETKVYGKLHTSLNMANNGDQSGFTLTSNTSRFGIKGGIGLNESVTAIFQFENSLDIANRGGTLASRNTFLGIKGGFGTLLAGIHDTPFKTLGRKVTFFKDSIGDFRTMTVGYDQRLNSVLVYATPKNDMWGGQIAYQLDQNDWSIMDDPDTEADESDTEAATALSLMAYVTPMEGDLFIGAAYETWSKGYVAGSYPDDEFVNSTGAFRVAAKWKGEKFAVSGLFQNVSDWYTIKGIDASTFGFEALFKAAEKWHVKGNFYNATVSVEGDDEDTKMSQFALGIDHVFAPRTMFYLQWAMVSNGDYGFMGIGGTTVEVEDGPDIGWGNGFGDRYAPAMKEDGSGYENPMAVSLGVVHTF